MKSKAARTKPFNSKNLEANQAQFLAPTPEFCGNENRSPGCGDAFLGLCTLLIRIHVKLRRPEVIVFWLPMKYGGKLPAA